LRERDRETTFSSSLPLRPAIHLHPSGLALVQRSPGADDLGVAGNTLASSHLVLGRIGQEDVVD